MAVLFLYKKETYGKDSKVLSLMSEHREPRCGMARKSVKKIFKKSCFIDTKQVKRRNKMNLKKYYVMAMDPYSEEKNPVRVLKSLKKMPKIWYETLEEIAYAFSKFGYGYGGDFIPVFEVFCYKGIIFKINKKIDQEKIKQMIEKIEEEYAAKMLEEDEIFETKEKAGAENPLPCGLNSFIWDCRGCGNEPICTGIYSDPY